MRHTVRWRPLAGFRAWVTGPAPTLPFMALLDLWVALNVGDLVTTLLALHCGLSCGREISPLSLAVLAQGGERALLLEKELTTMAGVGLLAVGWRHLPRGCFWLAVAVNVGMAFTVANNLFWLVPR